ncbi:hypothetical protein LCGC14_1143790 [marine sediment metagenome]|uniref:Uncharacterized protein n=1 Tax=marine sediment metagenome TaxID=412755 RepID=A0A0F9MKK5_9ZZZZ
MKLVRLTLHFTILAEEKHVLEEALRLYITDLGGKDGIPERTWPAKEILKNLEALEFPECSREQWGTE